MPVRAQLLTEQFDYGTTAGDLLSVATGWTFTGTNTTPNVQYTLGSLSFPNAPNTGGKLTFGANGQDVNRTFSPTVSTGTLYASCIVNIATTSATGDHFLSFSTSPASGTLQARVFVKAKDTGFEFGLAKGGTSGTTAVYAAASPTYTFNTSYFIVLRYSFGSNANVDDDVARLFVFPTTVPTNEPTAATDYIEATAGTGATTAVLGAFCVRQGTAGNLVTGSLDYIRVGTTWANVASFTIDNTAPTFANTFPKANNINNTTFDVASNINEVGKTYFVVLPDNATAPTAAQIKAGNDATNAAVANNLKGTINHTSANADFSGSVTGLTASTSYDVYAVAEDGSFNLNTPVKIDVTTTAGDVLAPTFANTYPKANAVALTTFTLASNINEIGKTYFVILSNNATAPTSAQVKAGNDATNTAVANNFKGTIDNTSANTEFTANITGLTENTDYDVYVVAEDAVPNVQTSPIKLDIKTNLSDNTAPTFTATYPKTSTVGSASFTLLSNINEAGKTYFVVVPDNATAPTTAQVKAGQNGAGTSLANNLKGTINNVAGNTEYSANVAGLTQATSYDVYVVAEDAPPFNAPNLQTTVQKLDVTTIVPNTNDIVEDFATCTTGTNIGSWTRFTVVGDAQQWGCTAGGRTNNGALMNGFAGSAQDNQDWLISPALDLSAFSGPNFAFWSKTRFQGPAIALRVSTNYTAGAPSTATWIDLTITLPAANSNVWTETKDLDLTAYKSSNTRLAFVYTSTTGTNTAAEWIVDDLKVYNKAPQIVLTKAQTLDVVTWNVEWFGDNTNGPTNETLQRNNIKTVIQQIDADIYCLQEVTNQNGENSFQTLVNELQPLGYTGVRVTHNSGFGDAQQARAFIYKSAIFSNVTTSVLSSTEAGSGWVDNRAPAMLKGDVTIEGTTKTFYFVSTHAKAGSTTGDFTQRQNNAVSLKTYLDGTRGADNVFFLGDFNDDLDVSIVTPNVSPYKNFVDDVTGYATPSKTALSDNNVTTFIGSTTPIDHIILSNEVNAMYYANSLKREDYTTLITDYANTTSDHYPVSARFQIGPVTPDATAPTFTTTFPKVTNVTTTAFNVESAINEAGKTYYVVVANNAPAPTAAQVKAGLDGAGNPLTGTFKGTLEHSAANVSVVAQVTGITILTDYDVYFVAEDIIPNLQANAIKVDMTAAPADIVPPTFTANFPKADQITSSAFRLVSNLSEPGKTYFVVLPNNATAPTSAQVKAGQDATGTAIATASFKGTINNTLATTDYTANVSGTLPNTDYDVYFTADDLFNNLQTSPTKLDVKTININFTSGYPKVDNITTTAFRVLTNMAETGKTYFVTLPNNADAPTSQQVKEGKNAAGTVIAANFAGTINNTNANIEYNANVIGADNDTNYDVYFVAENSFGSLQPAPLKIDVKTNAPTSAEDDLARYLTVYPNPAQDVITITLRNNPVLQKAHIQLVNTVGKEAQKPQISTTADGIQARFEVRNLPAGVYIIELSEGSRKFFRRVIVL
jgi:endonuclease/exonuclease/phosphatase family metal-dependent hydrolase